jgi:hypothetical protein
MIDALLIWSLCRNKVSFDTFSDSFTKENAMRFIFPLMVVSTVLGAPAALFAAGDSGAGEQSNTGTKSQDSNAQNSSGASSNKIGQGNVNTDMGTGVSTGYLGVTTSGGPKGSTH